ncbi:unnamed protein product [Gadus morhua 'NCC']
MNRQQELLSEAVRQYEHLYNPSLVGYKDTQKCSNSWDEIASNMGMPVGVCVNKWKSIRDKYVREKKAMQSRSGDAGGKGGFSLVYIAVVVGGAHKTPGDLLKLRQALLSIIMKSPQLPAMRHRHPPRHLQTSSHPSHHRQPPSSHPSHHRQPPSSHPSHHRQPPSSHPSHHRQPPSSHPPRPHRKPPLSHPRQRPSLSMA